MRQEYVTTVDLGNLAMGTLITFGPVLAVLGLMVTLVWWMCDHVRPEWAAISMVVLLAFTTAGLASWIEGVAMGENSWLDRHYPVVKAEPIEEGN